MNRFRVPLAMLALGAVLAAAIVALNLRDSAREATFGPWARDWRAPLAVDVDGRLGSYVTPALEALKTWNREIGCPVLRPARPGEVPAALVTWDDGDPCSDVDHAGAAAYVCTQRTPMEVRVRRLDDVADAYRVLFHEIGHAPLGLDHDPSGPMAKNLPPLEQGQVPIIVVSWADKAALAARYCKP